MWISKTIVGNAIGRSPFAARINGIVGGFKMCQPYGFKSVPKKGEKAVFMPAGDALYALGIIDNGNSQLNEGEVGLYSSGGASIILKNDGSVVINGRVFEREEE